MKMVTHYVYIIHEREFINSGTQIYKIGKTKQRNRKRFRQYPKQSALLFQICCNDCDQIEKEIINAFKDKYKHRHDIGNEYFEGGFLDMRDTMYSILKKEKGDPAMRQRALTRTEKMRLERKQAAEADAAEKEKLYALRLERKQRRKADNAEKEKRYAEKAAMKKAQKDAIIAEKEQKRKLVIDWLKNEINKNSLKDDFSAKIHKSYSNFVEESSINCKDTVRPITLSAWGRMMNENIEPFSYIKRCTKARGKLLKFNIEAIKNWLDI